MRTDARATDRRRSMLWVAGGSGFVMLGVVLIFLLVAGGSGDNGGNGSSGFLAALRKAGCTHRQFRSQGRNHVTELPEGFKYNSDPPTSGFHHPQTIIWGQYDAPIAELNSVHNLEHGGVIIHYGRGVPPGTIDRLTEFYRDDPNGLILAPLPSLGDEIALTAWTHLARCPRFDEEAFKAFRDEYRYHGPEEFGPEDLLPGGP